MISPSSPTAGGELCEAFSCIAERSRETAACYFAGSMVKYLYPIPKFYESGETMLNFRPICLEDRAWIEPVMQAAAGHGSEFSFVNLYLWGDQRVASVDGTPVFLSNFSGSLTYPWPVGCRDLPGTQHREDDKRHEGLRPATHSYIPDLLLEKLLAEELPA